MRKNESVKKEWNDAADGWVDFVRGELDYYRDGLNNPATFELMGDVRGKVVLDLACGEGYNTRILARKRAKVVGVDFSEKLIELARREEAREKLGIRYYVLDACDLKEFSDNSFDLVNCFMALQDIDDYEKATAEVARVLRNGGRFVFSMPHPCFEIITVKGKSFRASEKYFGAVKYPIEWDMKRLSKQFRTSSFHRTLTEYFSALHNSGLFVSRIVEPKPTRKIVEKYPLLRSVLKRPQSIVIESVKITDKERTRYS